MQKLWRFPGGLHLDGHKAESTTTPVAAARLPKRLVLPLQQHIGAPAKPLVAVGTHVLKGQVIAAASGYVSVPLHAPTSGTVVEIAEHAIPHPSGLSALCIVLESDGEDRWGKRHVIENPAAVQPSALRNVLREAGIVGLGGAGFPSFIKLNHLPGSVVDTLVLNGAECEPYITCDDMLMREHADEILAGLAIMRHALQARRCIIGIEDNKPEAYAAMLRAAQQASLPDVEVIQIPTRYPAGGEKQLIHVLTGKEVPSNGLPIQISVVCHNVATARAVYRAITHGEPLITRYVTVTGDGVVAPRNLDVMLGTPMQELIEQCGGAADGARLVMGGPMMGFVLRHSDIPVIKTTNCLLLTRPTTASQALPCIRCGACVDVCPAQLLPQQIYWHARAKDFAKTQAYNLFDCIECGACAAVCPSTIPLVQYYRFAKGEIWAQEREKQKADVARQRHEARLTRLTLEKTERDARHAEKKAALANKVAPRTENIS
ncbi:MAG: electron transport complex subunit RsxC [Gammaproteobacteria bacterium]|nr:electron transport complex subunit RsxC [Gammaproteobacteria bacterium]